MPRLFIPAPDLRAGLLPLSEEDQHRLSQVLRLRAGDAVEVFDGAGRRAPATLHIDPASALCLQVGPPEACVEPLPKLTLVVGLPSPERCDWLVEKLVELGVAAILPVQCARSQGGAQAKALLRRSSRWERLAVNAARQAERLQVPPIAEVQDFATGVVPAADEAAYVADFAESPVPPRDLAQARRRPDQPMRLVVGPPGGLTASEKCVLQQHGYTRVVLGPFVLRTETAAVSATSLLLYGGPN
jgi:16S rRNA (uracil1498-N3)-methyltransferase